MVQLSHPYMTTGKTKAMETYADVCLQSNVSAFQYSVWIYLFVYPVSLLVILLPLLFMLWLDQGLLEVLAQTMLLETTMSLPLLSALSKCFSLSFSRAEQFFQISAAYHLR